MRTVPRPRDTQETARGLISSEILAMIRLLLLLYLVPVLAQAQTPRIDTILYGASYYHEYMPYERLEQDVQLMEKAGLTVIRVGESTWSSWEPRDGEFEFDYTRGRPAQPFP